MHKISPKPKVSPKHSALKVRRCTMCTMVCTMLNNCVNRKQLGSSPETRFSPLCNKRKNHCAHNYILNFAQLMCPAKPRLQHLTTTDAAVIDFDALTTDVSCSDTLPQGHVARPLQHPTVTTKLSSNNHSKNLSQSEKKERRAPCRPEFPGGYPKMAFRSSSTVFMGMMLKLSTSTFSTFGV